MSLINLIFCFTLIWWEAWVCNKQDYHNHNTHHIRVEKKERKLALEIRTLVQMDNVMTGRNIQMTDSNFSLQIFTF